MPKKNLPIYYFYEHNKEYTEKLKFKKGILIMTNDFNKKLDELKMQANAETESLTEKMKASMQTSQRKAMEAKIRAIHEARMKK